MGGFAWVTLATNDSYSLGALVLAHSLRHAGTVHQLAVLVTPGVSTAMREQLAAVFDHVQEVNVLDSNDDANLALLARPDLGITFTKLHCWTLTQYTKCVFLDADTLVLQHCDELFDREEFSAAPDVGWPDCFNSGVFVYRPSVETFKKILDLALTRGSFDGGDQGLLNLYFNDWATQDSSRRLPFIYNMCSMATYSYLPAFKQFGSEAKIVHFIGPWKPWLLELNTQTGLVNPMSDNQHLLPLLQQWWSIFLSEVLPKLQANMSVQEPSMGMECEQGELGGMAGALAQLQIGNPRSEQQRALEQHWRRQAWEHGHIDYLGRDSFDKIWAKILETLSTTHIEDSAEPVVVQVEAQPEASTPVEAPSAAVEPETAQPGESAEPTPALVPPAQVEQPPLLPSAPEFSAPAQQIVLQEPALLPIVPSTPPNSTEPTTPLKPPPPISPLSQSSPQISPSSPLKSPPIQPTPPKSPPIQPSPPKSPPIQPTPPESPLIEPTPLKSPPIQSSPPKSPPIQPTPPKSPPIQPSPPKSPPIQQSPPKSPPIQPTSPKSPPIQPSPPKSPPIQPTRPKSPPIDPISTSLPIQQSPPKSPPILPSPRPKSPVLKAPEAGISVQATRPLAVGSETPPVTPPIALGPNQQPQASQSEAESAPIPPKRRGGPKGGKTAGQKGKK